MANKTNGGQLALAWATSKLGDPYVFGGQGPTGFDCSGLVMEAYLAQGVPLPRTTYQQCNVARVAGAWQAGDLAFIAGSDPGPNGEPGHVGMYVGVGTITDYSTVRHHFTAHPTGQQVFLNAPFTGDIGGIRYDYLTGVEAHTRPAMLLPNPPPVPALPPAKGHPTAFDVSNAKLVLMANVAQATEAKKNGWSLWYWSQDHKPHEWNPQVNGKPTGEGLYAHVGWNTPNKSSLPLHMVL